MFAPLTPAVPRGINISMSNLKIYEEIGDTVRLRRKQMNLTQKMLSQRINISRTSLANIEAGRQRLMVHQLIKLSSALEMDSRDLLPPAPKTKVGRMSADPVKLPEEGLSQKQRDQINLFMEDLEG